MPSSNNSNNPMLCLAAYNNRLASLFDTAVSLELYVVQDGSPVHSGQVMVPGKDASFRIKALLACGVDVLLCGAVSSTVQNLLEGAGIDVRPWLRGTLAEVLKAWSASDLDSLSMPGCRPEKNPSSRQRVSSEAQESRPPADLPSTTGDR